MNERRFGAFLLTLLVGGIAGGFGAANLSMAEPGEPGNAGDAKLRKPKAQAKPAAQRIPFSK
jgi:hypothetical protein